MKIFGLIGFPLSHSLSPQIHNAAFSALGLDAQYKLFPLKENELGDFLKDLRDKKIYGLNVTIPYKEKVIAYLDELSSEATLIGAVNTIKVKNEKLFGFNTDGQGFMMHLKGELGFNPRDKQVIILGAGGAAKAVGTYLAKEFPQSIFIYDLIYEKADGLAKHLKRVFFEVEILAFQSVEEVNRALPHCNLLINATPTGLKLTDKSIIKEEFLHSGLFVYDLIYNPAETMLLKLAQAVGARISNGLGMLLQQAAASFKIWTGLDAPIEVMQKALDD